MFTSVYGPIQLEMKDALWIELDNVGRLWSLPWVIVGDFNAVRGRAESSSHRASRYERDKFGEVVNDFGLLEPDKIGPGFTYRSGQFEASYSHLDRYPISPDWIDLVKELKGHLAFMSLITGYFYCKNLSLAQV